MTTSRWRVVVAVLWVAVLGSALGVVYGKQQARNRFNELQKLTTQRDDLDIEWGQLQLEQSTWAMQSRVEKIATGYLQMRVPPADRMRVVPAAPVRPLSEP